MFKSISWQEYLYAIGLIGGAYYGVLGAIFYYREILSRLKGERFAKDKSVTAGHPDRADSFMGSMSNAARKKIPIKQSVATEDEFSIETDHEVLLAAQRADSPASELYDRLVDFFKVIQFEKVEKPNLKGIKVFFVQYPDFKDTSVQQEVTSFVYDHFKKNTEAKFTREEIDALWSNGDSQSTQQTITNK